MYVDRLGRNTFEKYSTNKFPRISHLFVIIIIHSYVYYEFVYFIASLANLSNLIKLTYILAVNPVFFFYNILQPGVSRFRVGYFRCTLKIVDREIRATVSVHELYERLISKPVNKNDFLSDKNRPGIIRNISKKVFAARGFSVETFI